MMYIERILSTSNSQFKNYVSDGTYYRCVMYDIRLYFIAKQYTVQWLRAMMIQY